MAKHRGEQVAGEVALGRDLRLGQDRRRLSE